MKIDAKVPGVVFLRSRMLATRKSERGDVLGLMVGLFILMAIGLMIVFVWGVNNGQLFNFSQQSETASENTNAQEQVVDETEPVVEPEPPVDESDPIAAPAPAAENTTPEEKVEFPAGMVFGIIGAFFAFLILIVASTAAFHWAKTKRIETRTASTQRKESQKKNLEAWTKLFKKHDELVERWADYELDIEKLIRFPTLTDTSHPKVQRLHKALQEASYARPDAADKDTWPLTATYGKAVNTLEVAMTAAVDEAKLVAWKNFTVAEQRKLNVAMKMLKMAQDSAASPHERQAAYKRVQAELDGLIIIPEKQLAALETTVRKSLTAVAV